MKVIEISDAGYVWHVPLQVIAEKRADYYVERDPDTTRDEEISFVMDDDFEGLDWYRNNMDFEDIAERAKLIETPAPKTEPGHDAETTIRTIENDS